MNEPSLTPLTDTDIEWRPFVRDPDVLQEPEALVAILGFSEDELREYAVSLWEDRRALRDTLHDTLAMLARTTAQLDRYRDAVHTLRDVRRTREKDQAVA